jgi:hypothetical protein
MSFLKNKITQHRHRVVLQTKKEQALLKQQASVVGCWGSGVFFMCGGRRRTSSVVGYGHTHDAKKNLFAFSMLYLSTRVVEILHRRRRCTNCTGCYSMVPGNK